MCLNTVLYSKSRQQPNVGYKIFNRYDENENIFGENHSHFNVSANGYKLNKWYKAKKAVDRYANKKLYRSMVESNDSDKYSVGFHIYLDIEQAREHIKYYHPYSPKNIGIYEVNFKDLVAIGEQTRNDKGITIVATQMKIVKKVP